MAAGVDCGSSDTAATAAAAAGAAPTAAFAGVVPVGRLIFMPAAGDVLAISLAFGFSGELEVFFNGDDLRCVAAEPLPTDSWGRRVLLAPTAGAECVNLGAGRAVKVLVMVVVVVVLLAEPPLAVADLMRVVLVLVVVLLLGLATPLDSGLVGLRVPDKLPVVLGGLRSAEDTVLRGDRAFPLAADVAPRLLEVVAGLLAATCRRDLVAVADALLHVVELANLRAVVVVVVLVVERAAAVVAGLAAVLLRLPAVLLLGAVAGRALLNVLLVVRGAGLPAVLLAVSGLRAVVLLVLVVADVLVVVEALALTAPVAGAVRGRAAVAPNVVLFVIGAGDGLLAAALVAVGAAVLLAAFLSESLGLALILGFAAAVAAATVAPTAAAAAVAATAATATSATGVTSAGSSAATGATSSGCSTSAGSLGSLMSTAGVSCCKGSTGCSTAGAARIGCSTIGSCSATGFNCSSLLASGVGSGVSTLARPFV